MDSIRHRSRCARRHTLLLVWHWPFDSLKVNTQRRLPPLGDSRSRSAEGLLTLTEGDDNAPNEGAGNAPPGLHFVCRGRGESAAVNTTRGSLRRVRIRESPRAPARSRTDTTNTESTFRATAGVHSLPATLPSSVRRLAGCLTPTRVSSPSHGLPPPDSRFEKTHSRSSWHSRLFLFSFLLRERQNSLSLLFSRGHRCGFVGMCSRQATSQLVSYAPYFARGGGGGCADDDAGARAPDVDPRPYRRCGNRPA